jgi:hypothetical protein
VARSIGLPDARIAVIRHPLGGIAAEEVTARAGEVTEETLALLK